MSLEIILIACVVSVACALPGVFIVLRRMALMSDAISHSVLPGIVAGFFVAGSLDSAYPMIGAVAASMATVLLTELLYKSGLVKSDAAIGTVFPAMFSIGVIVVSRYASDIHLDVDAVLLGELALAPLDRWNVMGFSIPRSLGHMGLILFLNLGLLALFYKELKLSTFDPGLAKSQGFRPGLIHYGLMLMVSVTAVGAFDSVGSILVVALMVAPAAAALLLAERLSRILVIACAIGMVSSVSGFFLAQALDASIAGAMATMTGVSFLLALLFSPRRGLLTRWNRARRQKWEFAMKMLTVHLLHHEGLPSAALECRADHLTDHIHWSASRAQAVVRKALETGLIGAEGPALTLTGKGRTWAHETMELG